MIRSLHGADRKERDHLFWSIFDSFYNEFIIVISSSIDMYGNIAKKYQECII